MKCTNCGQEIGNPRKFCPNCGAPIEETQEAENTQVTEVTQESETAQAVEPTQAPEAVPAAEPVQASDAAQTVEPVQATKPTRSAPKNADTPFYNRWWFWVIVAIVLLTIIDVAFKSPEKTTAAAEPTIVETTAAEIVVPEATAAAKVSKDNSEALDVAVSLIKGTVGDCFENFEIYHEDNVITINVWQDGISLGAAMASRGDSENLAAWNELIVNQKKFCVSICDFVDTLGLDDVMVVVNLLNDTNRDKTLLSIAEGYVTYDCVSE